MNWFFLNFRNFKHRKYSKENKLCWLPVYSSSPGMSALNQSLWLAEKTKYSQEFLRVLPSRRRLIGGKRHLVNINSKTLLSDDLKSRISEWNSLDAEIFQKSNETFWEKYKSIPNLSTLENEFGIETGTWKLTSKFELPFFIFWKMFPSSIFILERVTNFCLADEKRDCEKNDPRCSYQPPGVHLKGLVLRPEAENDQLCLSLVMPELAYTNKLNFRQWPKWPTGPRHLPRPRKWSGSYVPIFCAPLCTVHFRSPVVSLRMFALRYTKGFGY